jgi:hypothetical protein
MTNRLAVFPIVVLILAAGTVGRVLAQTQSAQAPSITKPRTVSQSWKRPALSVSVGIAFPLSKDAVKQYWSPGMSGSAAILLPAEPSLLVGLAFDASSLRFDEAAFETAYPGVPPNSIDLGVFNLQLLLRRLFRPGMRFSPWLEGGLGGALITGATYREVINGARVTYFDVKRTTRLSASACVGADIFFNAALALSLRGKFSYLINDPSIGVLTLADAGLRIRL